MVIEDLRSALQAASDATDGVEIDLADAAARNAGLTARVAELEAALERAVPRGSRLGACGALTSLLDAGAKIRMQRIYHPNADDIWFGRDRDAIAARRVPVSSFKPIVDDQMLPWADVGAGEHRALIESIAAEYAALGSEAWVTCLHEPYDDRTATNTGPAFAAMTTEVSAVFARIAPNVRYYVCFTGYHIGLGASSWLPPSTDFELLGVDNYDGEGNLFSPKTPEQAFDKALALAKQISKPLVIAEMGSDGDAAKQERFVLRTAIYILRRQRIAAALYFNQPHPGATDPDWRLSGEAVKAFADVSRIPWFADAK